MRTPIFLGVDPDLAEPDWSDAATLFHRTGGNTGNLAFLSALRSHLGGEVRVLPLGAPAREVRAAGDLIVLPLANQLGDHTDLSDWANWLSDYDLPVLGFGLGAQANRQNDRIILTPGTRRWLATMARLSPGGGASLGMRGPYSAEVVAQNGHAGTAAVTGCPSNFTVAADPSPSIARGFERVPERVAVTAGIPFLPALARVERLLVPLCVEPDSYIVQHGLEMIRLAYREFDRVLPDELELTRDYLMPDRDMAEFERWCGAHAVAFHDTGRWMAHLRGFDFVVGTRIHGVMLALQAGVAAGCITHDSRTEEMCQTMGVPYCNYRKIDPLRRETLLDHFRFDREAYRATRRTLLDRYLAIYADADVAVSDHLRALSRAV